MIKQSKSIVGYYNGGKNIRDKSVKKLIWVNMVTEGRVRASDKQITNSRDTSTK